MGMAETFFKELCEAFLTITDNNEMENFLRDLCTPTEIAALSERWHVCRLLHRDELSYREIHRLTGVSLVTIGRVARFLRTDSHGGYHALLRKFEDGTLSPDIKNRNWQ
ncbi:MAG: trp operon repressor [Puniceicoccales bacterium]|jgi:TrpR-related protein YerC/YecD|nr:trp operon repressor [Puniceicoccales bacterium]